MHSTLAATPPATAAAPSGAVEIVRRVLSLPDDELDYAEAKLAFDRAIDPAIDADAVTAELDSMAATARELAGASPDDHARLNALRKLIYQSGPWNGHRPFGYDHSDPLGTRIRGKLLSNYLATRRGQCVSMPILFLILGERLGLDLALATAPEHVFVRHRDRQGRVVNLETTSGAHPASDAKMRQGFPMTDLSVRNGLYLRSLPKREAVAEMASTLVEHLAEKGRHYDVLWITWEILRHSPRNIHAILSRGTAYGHLIETEIVKKYPMPFLLPVHLRSRYEALCQRHKAAFDTADALGWAPE
jgi:regulator of sirC expression with transglutaminase-like and TPR domain